MYIMFSGSKTPSKTHPRGPESTPRARKRGLGLTPAAGNHPGVLPVPLRLHPKTFLAVSLNACTDF